jgi:hypothetical protein
VLQRHRVVVVEVVDADHAVAARQQALRDVRADEAGDAGDEEVHGKMDVAPPEIYYPACRQRPVLNRPAAELPARCQVLVVAPARPGSAAAARAGPRGVEVVLVDQHAFPRDKVCGDGLIPRRAPRARALGVLDEVMAGARPARHLRCVGAARRPDRRARHAGVLPRRELDLILCRAAAEAGARMHAPLRFSRRSRRPARVGARLQDPAWRGERGEPRGAAIARSAPTGCCWPPARCRRR